MLLTTEVWTELPIVIFVTRNRKKQLPSRDAVVCRPTPGDYMAVKS